MKFYRNHPGLCAAAILVWLNATAGAAPIFTENFNTYAGTQNDTQYQTGLKVAHTGSVTGWSKSGAGTMHAVNLNGSGNWAIMFWQDNVITLATGIAANTSGVTYQVDFDYGAAVYSNPGQVTGAGDGLLVEVVRAAGTTLASNTYQPGAWSYPSNANLSAARHGTLTYVGDGTGVVRLRIGPAPLNSGRFAGEIDNLSVSEPAPTLAGSGIVDDKGGASVASGTLVTYTVTFSKDMDAATVSAADFGNAGTAGVSIELVTETAPGIFTVPVTPTSAGTLQLKVNAGAELKDPSGNALVTTPVIADDTTLTVFPAGDTTPPTLTSITDDKGGGPAERNALVTYTVTFDEDMDGGTVSAADFGNAVAVIDGGAAVNIGTVTQTAAAVFSVQATPTTTGTLRLQIIAGAGLKDVAGNDLVTTTAIPDDTTLAVNDTIPPVLTSIVDDKSPATVAPNTLVTYTVTFNEDMDAGTVSAADFGNAVAVLDGGAAVSIGTVTETTPGVFTVQATPTSGGTLRLQVNAGAELKDVAGNALVTTPAILDDTTITVDGTPPTLASLSPADDATGVTLNANLAVTFSEAIAIGTGYITLKNLSNAAETTIAITDGTQVSVAGSVLTINPAADFSPAMNYAVQIDATAIKDSYGNFFAGIVDDTRWNFTVGNLVAFTTVGTTTWTAPPGVTSVGVLAVGGGGGGGWHAGGGGGAGGLVYTATHAVTPGSSYSLTVGAGGLGAVNHGNPNCDPPTSGGNSAFDTLSAVGGGSGAYSTWLAHFAAAAGGSGGGGFVQAQFGADKLLGGAGTLGQGNAGANGVEGISGYSGGGGGAGTPGSTKNGGNGLDYSAIFGTGYGVSGWFAGGGGAGNWYGGTPGTGGTGGGGAGGVFNGNASHGLANTGGGGGGGAESNGACGNGGSGIVLLSIAGFTPPVKATLNPANTASGVADTANLVVTFDQAVQAGTGNIEIRKSGDDSLIELIDVTSGLVTISGVEATINPSANLPAGTECYVLIPAGAFTAASGSLLPFAGITDNTTWSFTTAGPPVVAILNPADDAVDVLSNVNLAVTFDQAVQAGTGNIEIRKSGDDSLIESIDVTSGLVTIAGAEATINPAANLPLSTGCYVLIPAGALTATTGSLQSFAGITDTTTWSFTTGAVLADVRGDFRTTTAGGTTADFNGGTGLSDTQGAGRWNYLNGAASTLLTFGSAGNAGKSMYMTAGQTDGLPALGDQQIFGDVPAPAAGKIQWHAGATTAQSAVMRWTAGAGVTNLSIAGNIARGSYNASMEGNTEFDILVNGVNRFTITLNDTALHPFNVSGLSISAGQHVQFILSTPTSFNGAAIADLQATISGDLDTTPPTLASSGIVDDQSGAPVVVNSVVTYAVTFSEGLDASTVSAADFGNAGSAAVTIGTVTQTAPAVFSVPVTPTGAGTLQLEVNAGAVLKDLAGNALVTTTAIADDTTLSVRTPYQQWLAANSKTDSPANLKEFAFGTTNQGVLVLNPNGTINTRGQAPIIQTTVGSPLVKLVYARLKNSGCSYTAQFSQDLTNWLASNNPNLIYPPGVPDEEVVPDGVDMEIVSIKFPLFMNTGGGNFEKIEQGFCQIAVTTP